MSKTDNRNREVQMDKLLAEIDEKTQEVYRYIQAKAISHNPMSAAEKDKVIKQLNAHLLDVTRFQNSIDQEVLLSSKKLKKLRNKINKLIAILKDWISILRGRQGNNAYADLIEQAKTTHEQTKDIVKTVGSSQKGPKIEKPSYNTGSDLALTLTMLGTLSLQMMNYLKKP